MDKKIKGDKLISLLGIAPSDLAEHIENGLPACTRNGKEVFINSNPPSQKASDNARYRHTVHEMSIERGQGEISSDISFYPPGLHGIDLPLPQDDKKAGEIINEILGFYFSIDDYEEFAKIHALESLINKTEPETSKMSVQSKAEPAVSRQAETDRERISTNESPKLPSETSLKNLIISHENDSEIRIQVSKRKAKTVTCETLGFRDAQTLGWKTFLQILQEPDHTYDVGPAHTHVISADRPHSISLTGDRVRNNDYDKKRGRLKHISKKIVDYLNKFHSFNLPPNYSLFEQPQDMPKGNYKPKFKVGPIHRYDSDTQGEILAGRLSNTDLVENLKKAAHEYHKNKHDEKKKSKVIILAKEVILRECMDTEEVEELINPKW